MADSTKTLKGTPKTTDILTGDELMIFIGGKAVAFATSHSLSLSGNTLDIASKDHGYWGASKVGKLTWEITSENIYTLDDFDALYDAYTSRNKVTLVWGKPSNYAGDGIVDSSTSWTAPSAAGTYYQGDAVITSLSVNAATGDNATISATFTGVNSFVRK